MAKKKGNRDKHRAYRRKAHEAKRKAKRASLRALSQARGKGGLPPGLRSFTDADHLFWVCHGINCLVSDYEKGLWRPLFPEIYEDHQLSPDVVANRTMTAFKEDPEDEGFSISKAATAWAIQDKATVYVYKNKALKVYKRAHPEDSDAETAIRQPHTSVVWKIFDGLKTLMESRAN